ncbi:MAG: ABC transporter permease [Pseudomonadota bacterium]|nr:ABC transporter permease [Pseudomonadota bacterium]
MLSYILKRTLYMIPILLGVNIITFMLFFMVNTPDDMARMQLGNKNITPDAIERWKISKGYDKPLFYNQAENFPRNIKKTLFYSQTKSLVTFEFGTSDGGRDINFDIKKRMYPSLAIAVPSLILGILVNISFSLLIVFFRNSYIEKGGIVLCIILMSISGLFYIIAGQYLVGKLWKLVPISGYIPGINAISFIILPVTIAVISGIGSGVRWYRTLLLEEYHKPYAITARSKGLSQLQVLSRHILPNSLIPIVTSVVAILPLIFLGSLLTESFFGIPGLGSYTIDAISQQDFAIIRAMVFLGTVLYMIGLILTDIVYTIVDPRIRFN